MRTTRALRLRLFGRVGSTAVGIIAMLASATTALAAVLTASPPVRVVDNPLATKTVACRQLVAQQTALGSVNFPDAEVEPFVAVDPTNGLHLVASFQQDRWNDGGSSGLTNVVSTDGGKTWTLARQQPTFSICAGATPGSAGF